MALALDMTGEGGFRPAWRAASANRNEPAFARAASFPEFDPTPPENEAFPADVDKNLAAVTPAKEAAPSARPLASRRKLLAAVAVSCFIHICVAAFLVHLRNEGIKIAGGEQAGIAMIGSNADADEARIGPDEAVTEVSIIDFAPAKPQETPRVAAVSVEKTTVSALAPAALAPTEMETLAPAETAPAVRPEPPQAVVAATPAPPLPQVLAVERAVPAEDDNVVPPVAAVEVERTAPAAVAPQKPQPVEKAQASPPAERVAALPSAKPEPKKQPERKPAPAAKQKQESGSRGAGRSDRRRGAADGREAGTEVAASRGGSAAVEGNAAVSNYPGRIVARLKRALRYPSAAGNRRLRGEVQVQFVVSRAGEVSGARVVRSSGSPVLDQAALDTVRRAAPFPPIPEGSGRASWPFTVPLAFVR